MGRIVGGHRGEDGVRPDPKLLSEQVVHILCKKPDGEEPEFSLRQDTWGLLDDVPGMVSQGWRCGGES